MFEIGTGMADITAFKKGIGMMGYGMHFNTVREIATALSARAFVIKNAEAKKKIVFVNAEMCFITIAVKSAVVKQLNNQYPNWGYTMDNVILTAQHTHSAPGGYSHYAFYNFSIPGFVPQVFDAIVSGIVEAIVMAENNKQLSTIKLGKGTFDANVEVAFNRSIAAYNSNPEVKKLSVDETHLAVDREMALLRIDNDKGNPIGMINWFGVHTTSISNDNQKICSDNKGYAASYFEADLKAVNKNFVAAFAQNIAGDISPNFIWDTKKNWMRGKLEDDFESAQFNGKQQYLKAKEIFEAAVNKEPLSTEIDYVLTNVDFSNVIPDKEFTGGKDVTTSPGCHGVSFFEGTAEGPGMSGTLGSIARFFSKRVKKKELDSIAHLSAEEKSKILKKYQAQGNKDILIETGEAKILGVADINKLLVPSWIDKSVGNLKKQYRAGALQAPWVPQILPLQLIIIGELAIAAFPGEITTVAGMRLKKTIHSILAVKGIKEVIISSYANAYCGYVTTNEEYQCQLYEGGHTIYGEWTLAAFQTKFKQLALQLLEKFENRRTDEGVNLLEFSQEELSKRSFKEE